MYLDPTPGRAARSRDDERDRRRSGARDLGRRRLGPARAAGQAALDGSFDDRLVEALAELIEEWAPEPAPAWVTAVPSLRHPDLVADFAERLAARLGLPYRPVVTKIEERPAQKQQNNAAHQQRNIERRVRRATTCYPMAPVLLVDDVVDSAWTMTEVGRLLRRAGVSLVYPVALASSAGRD